MNVLVVDDQSQNRFLLRCLLEEQDYGVIEADNGQAAVDAVLKDKPDIVLMDVMMPGMDGFEATRIIKSTLTDEHLPIIFVTGVTSENELADALSVGGDDFLVKPFHQDILSAKLQAHARIKHLHAEVSNKNNELRNYKDIMDEERDIAKHVFKSALRNNCLDLPHIQSYVSPATTFNGDLLLAIPGPSGNFYILMADFTGHGLPAAIGAIPLSQAFFKQARQGCSIGDMALQLNELLRDVLPSNMFCAATLIEQASNGENFTLWSGGVPEGYLLAADGSVKSELETLHMPLGILCDQDFERDVHVMRLNPGEAIVTFTDGLTEAENADSVMFGDERLVELLNKSDINTVDDIMSAHAKFMGGRKPDDDVTVLKVLAGPMQLPDLYASQEPVGAALEWSLSFVLDRETLSQDVSIPSQLVNMIGAEVNIVAHKDYLHSIITECYSNALEHGILGLSSSLKDTEAGYDEYYAKRAAGLKQLPEDASIEVSFKFTPGSVNRLNMMFKDSGAGFDHLKLKRSAVENEDDRAYGRGVHLIDALCESLVYSNGGTRVDAVYQIS